MTVVFKNVKLLNLEEFLRDRETQIDEILAIDSSDIVITYKHKNSKITFYRSTGTVLVQGKKLQCKLRKGNPEVILGLTNGKMVNNAAISGRNTDKPRSSCLNHSYSRDVISLNQAKNRYG